MFSFKSFLLLLSWLLHFTYSVPTRSTENLLNQIKLDEYPMAKCNDGSTAVYYRKPLNSDQETKKLLVYLKGGGFCVPFVPGILITYHTPMYKTKTGFGCEERCADTDDPFPLCTAASDPYFDQDTWYSDSIFSQDPSENPAFFDYNIGRHNEHLIQCFFK